MTLTSIARRSLLTAAAAALVVGGALPAAALAAPVAPATSAHAATSTTPSDVLASTPWKTTSAVDQDGRRVALDHPAVANFVGWAYFKADGTYTMYNLDDSPKLRGDWTVAADGSSRWINAKDANGNVLFQRVVPIVRLDKNVFTYRVFPNTGDTSIHYDIVHTRTNHVEPGTDGRGPGANGSQGNSGNGGYHHNHGNKR